MDHFPERGVPAADLYGLDDAQLDRCVTFAVMALVDAQDRRRAKLFDIDANAMDLLVSELEAHLPASLVERIKTVADWDPMPARSAVGASPAVAPLKSIPNHPTRSGSPAAAGVQYLADGTIPWTGSR